MTMYCFYQTDSKGPWHLSLASERHTLVKNKGAKLITALDVDNDFSTQLSAEEQAAVKQTGDLFFDFDEELSVCIEQFKKFLVLLQSKNVNLNQCRLYATGGRGFHCFVPMQVFMPKVNPNGLAGLVYTYREMAQALYVDGMDVRIYSSKKGRQLRCANVERENGNFKVQITAEEAFAMTAEKYAQVCASPRNDLPVEQATFSPDMGLLYSVSQDRVTKALVKRKSRKPDADILKRFKGEWPETLTLILNGLGLKEGVGWNYLSLQLAVAASALGKSEEQLLQDAEPLIESHGGDSSRYNTPHKRRRDLRDMYAYVYDNPCFEFAAGPILALLIPEVRANSDLAWGSEYTPDPKPAKPKTEKPEHVVQEGGTVVESAVHEPEVEQIDEDDESCPVLISRGGIFTKTENGPKRACSIGIGRTTQLRRLEGQAIGYEVEVFKDHKPQGVHTLTMDKLSSRSTFQSWTSQWSASMSASDVQTARIMDVLSRRAERNNDVTYIVTREGIDLIVPPGAKSEDDFEIIWASPSKVISSKGTRYVFRNTLDKDGTYKSDLMNAPDLSAADEELIYNLLRINTDENLAKMLGWFSAAFMNQIIRRFYRQFPSLQLFGLAGSGKSKTSGLLNHLHYYMRDPKAMQASGQTMYPLIVAVASSSSQPVVFEEVKQREMTVTSRNFMLNLLRNNYDGHSISRGALNKDSASKDVTVNEFANSGSVCFVGESVESQSAILERCIVVSLAKQDRYGRSEHYHYAAKRRTELGKLGKAMAASVLALDITGMRRDLDDIFEQVQESLGPKAEEMERPAFNIAVVILGLKLMGDTLHRVFGSKFDAQVEQLKSALLNNASSNIPKNMSEASRVLDVMAQLSRSQDTVYQLVPGVDYTINQDGCTMDLKLRTAYAKYVKWQRSLGMEVLFDNENAFIAGLSNYAGTLRKACPDNLDLYDSPKAVIYRLSLEYLDKEDVDGFK